MPIDDSIGDTGPGEEAADPEDEALGSGLLLDFISGEKHLKETGKELVRQRIARALFHEYGISVEDMAADFPAKIDGRRKRLDIAIFHHDAEHQPENVSRVVVCRPEPKQTEQAPKIRDYEQADQDLDELRTIMTALPSTTYGLWTNGLDFFFLKKVPTRFEVRYEPIGDWPMADESVGTKDVKSHAQTRRAQADMLRTAFRRCHNFIHGNQGLPKDAAFWQFLYLIFCKMHDEAVPWDRRRFWAGPNDQFTDEGRSKIRERIESLFAEVKQEHSSVFEGNEQIVLTDRALAFMVSELAKYDFTRTDVDAKGAAYQEIVGDNLRGDKGQYFTPRGVIKLAVAILDPQENERVLDPACGTGGFLVATLDHMLRNFRSEANVTAGAESTEEFESVHERLQKFALTQVFGADFDPFLVRASQMNMLMAGDGHGHLYHMDSLEFPKGQLDSLPAARQDIPFETIDVLLTNPPFGSKIKITEPSILKQYQLAHTWEPDGNGNWRNTGKVQASMTPDILFIEQCLNWLRPGGRMAIVLPDGLLGNPGDEAVRWWILQHARVLASVDIPVEAFIVEANVNILTSLLFLQKKTEEERKAEALSGPVEYPVFMAVADRVGYDRRGKTTYRRRPDGEEITELVEKVERIRIGDRVVTRTLQRRERIVADDLPLIAEEYRVFRLGSPLSI